MTEGHVDVVETIPAWRTPTAHADESDGGVSLETLAPGTIVTVDTRNSRYRITVLDGPERDVLVQGGVHLATALRGRLQGSDDGDAVARDGWIEPNRRLLFVSAAGRIVTSPVASVSLEPSGASLETEQ